MAGMNTPALAYLRVSGKDQVDGDGFTRQLQTIEKYAAANGYRVVQVFEERGVSGKNELENRPALLDLIDTAKRDRVSVILFEKMDRLARALMIQETILAEMQRKGLMLISAMEPDLCSDDPTRIMMRQIFGAIAQYEKTMIVSKLRGARQRYKAKHGRCEGRKPFGYREHEAATLEFMRRLRADGASWTAIAEQLNGAGYGTRQGAPWRASTVCKVLGREA